MVLRIQQRCYAPNLELSEIPYVDVASLMPYNYFNTNPVHVLRTLHFPSIVVPPIYPFLPGKEYLQGGQFADYDDSVRLRETLMLLAKTPLKGLDDVGNPQAADASGSSGPAQRGGRRVVKQFADESAGDF